MILTIIIRPMMRGMIRKQMIQGPMIQVITIGMIITRIRSLIMEPV